MTYIFYAFQVRERTFIDEKGNVQIVLEKTCPYSFFSLPYGTGFDVEKQCHMVTFRYLKSQEDNDDHVASRMREHLWCPDHFICVIEWDTVGRTVPVGYQQGDYNHEPFRDTKFEECNFLEFVPHRNKIQGFLQGLF